MMMMRVNSNIQLYDCGCDDSVSELKSSLAALTRLSLSHHQLSHARVAIDNMMPASSARSCYHGDEGMIELRDVDDDRHCGWSTEMTSSDFPLLLTPLALHQSDWQLQFIDLRMTFSLSSVLSMLNTTKRLV